MEIAHAERIKISLSITLYLIIYSFIWPYLLLNLIPHYSSPDPFQLRIYAIFILFIYTAKDKTTYLLMIYSSKLGTKFIMMGPLSGLFDLHIGKPGGFLDFHGRTQLLSPVAPFKSGILVLSQCQR